MVNVDLDYLKAHPSKVASNGVRYYEELSDKRQYTVAAPNATTNKMIGATPDGMAASNTTGICLVDTTAPLKWNTAGTIASGESGDVLVVGFDAYGNFTTEKVEYDDTDSSGTFTKNFYCFPTLSYAHVLDNTLLDSGDDFQIIDSAGTAKIIGNIDATTYDLAVPCPAIVVPPKGFARVNYLYVAVTDTTANVTIRAAIYDPQTGETTYPKSGTFDNSNDTWYDYTTVPYHTLLIEGGLKGKVFYLDQTAAGDESSDTTTIKIDYDLWALGSPGGIQGAIEVANRTSSTQQS